MEDWPLSIPVSQLRKGKTTVAGGGGGVVQPRQSEPRIWASNDYTQKEAPSCLGAGVVQACFL